MHHDLDILNVNKDRLRIERLPINEVVKQVLRLCKGPVAEHISRYRRDGLGPERPRIAFPGKIKTKVHLVTLLKDCHKFLARSAIIKKKYTTIYCMSLDVLSLYMHNKVYI